MTEQIFSVISEGAGREEEDPLGKDSRAGRCRSRGPGKCWRGRKGITCDSGYHVTLLSDNHKIPLVDVLTSH